MQLLEHADVAVVHAGASTLNECINTGTPILMYPYKAIDQHGNAARIVYHELGRIGEHTDSADDISEHLSALLTDPTYRTNIKQMQKRIQHYTDEDIAVKTVERLLLVENGSSKTTPMVRSRR